MDKINFKNFPDLTTPLSASNLNQLQDNVETAINGILESGSNANGRYIKFVDGTLIQWNNLSVQDQAINNAYGPLYQSSRQITFPIDFYDTNYSPSCGQFHYGTGATWGTVWSRDSKSKMTLRVFDIASRNAGATVNISWKAIGRWKA